MVQTGDGMASPDRGSEQNRAERKRLKQEALSGSEPRTGFPQGESQGQSREQSAGAGNKIIGRQQTAEGNVKRAHQDGGVNANVKQLGQRKRGGCPAQDPA